MNEMQKWSEASKDKAIMSDWETGKVSLEKSTKLWNERKGTNLTNDEFVDMAKSFGYSRMLYYLENKKQGGKRND